MKILPRSDLIFFKGFSLPCGLCIAPLAAQAIDAEHGKLILTKMASRYRESPPFEDLLSLFDIGTGQ